MLLHKLPGFFSTGGGGVATIEFVDSTGRVTAFTGSTTVDLPVDLLPSDLIISATGADIGTPNIPTGYTQIARGSLNTVGYQASYKIMGDPVDTQVTGLSNGETIPHIFLAFRGVHTSTVLDVTPTQSAGTTGTPNPPAISTVTANSAIVILGYLDDDRVANTCNPPAGYEFGGACASNGKGFTTMAGYLLDVPIGTEDPGAFTGGTDAWYAITIALRGQG